MLIRYFEGFNALRFFAAYLVLLAHAETIRAKYGLFSLTAYSFFQNGGLAVEFFFVLSGFLITYLLLSEQHRTGTVKMKQFYMRRVLRIWPLYYILVFLGLVLVPMALHFVAPDKAALPYPYAVAGPLYVLFLPNLVNAMYGSSLLSPLWSIGVEEQFYLIWAPIVKFLRKYLLYVFGAIILLKVLFAQYFLVGHTGELPLWVKFVKTLKFEAMAIGGLGAYLIYKKPNWPTQNVLFHPVIQVFMFALLFARIAAHQWMMQWTAYAWIFEAGFGILGMSLLFLWLLLNVSLNQRRLFSTVQKQLDFLGEISYGIYMYHMLVLFFVVLVGKPLLQKLSPLPQTLIFYALVSGGTILIAYLSYRFLEKPFLRLKKRFLT